MRALVLSTLLILSVSSHAGDLPDSRITPGAVDHNITQSNIQQTVCQKGYTKTVRPPAYFTNKLKKTQIRQYGYPDQDPRHYEEDHLIPLNIGGAPDDPKNLWPQPRNSQWNSARKDDLEFKLYKQVCERRISLIEAQKTYTANWITAYEKYVGW